MKKLCLILTVLYAFGANCSAQSSLNIAENLLTEDNSTFESSMGDWTCNDNYACSIESESGHSGNYLKLTDTGASNDYAKQMEYNLSGHTPANGTRYVIKFWARKESGSGQIKVLLQKNDPSQGWPQKAFNNDNPVTVSNDWTHYEFDIIANRGDYQVIKINFGNCGEVWIDDIEYGEYTDNVAPIFTKNLNSFYEVGEGGTLNLTVAASGIPTPEYQWYRNTTHSTVGATPIDGATTASYSVPTEAQGTTYYYCVATNSQSPAATSTIAEVKVTAPVQATGVTLDKTSASVKQGKTLILTATVEPADAANKNVTWSSSDTSVATVSNGVVTGVATGNAKITATTVNGNHTASCMVTVTTSLPPVLIADFNDIKSLDGIISAHYAPNVTPTPSQNMYIELISDPYSNGKYVAVSDGWYKRDEYCTINLPDNLNIKDYGFLAFDICYPGGSTDPDDYHELMTYKDIPIDFIYQDGNKNTQTVKLATFHTPVSPEPVWDTKMIDLNPLAGINFKSASNFQIKIGPINSKRCIYYLDNIRIKENVDDVEDFEQDGDLSDIWWKVDENNTLYIRGNGVIPDYTGNKQCPWADQIKNIKHVVVGEGITGIGNYSVGNSENDEVDITLHSIPEYFGANCLKNQYNEGLTRTLHLELRDTEKPFIAKSKSENFPTFNTAKYYRDVTSNYSTVCLPFPVAKETVTAAGVELFDFTSIEKNGEQYTLAFSEHSGDMVAGQTYLIKNNNINNIEVTLEKTNVTAEQFNLTPLVSEKTVKNIDPTFSISMTGVFQPSVFGPNLEIEGAPVYTYGFKNKKFYMNNGNMSVRPMRGYFYGSQLYSEQQSGAKKMPKMFNFGIVPDIETHISSPDFIAEDFNIEEVYSPSGMKTNSLNKGLNIIRTSTGRVLKVMVK